MEPDRFDNLVRALFSTPSRRALNRALVGLAVGTLLAPLLRVGDAAAKDGKKAHKRKERRRNKRRKKVSNRCEKKYEFCPAGQGDSPNAGEYSQCCSTATDPEGNPYEVCSKCGCCPYNSECCISGGDGLCCPSGSKCSNSVDFSYSACCAPEDKICFGGCCNAEDECCTTTANVPYCCSGAEKLTCKKSGGPTCVPK